MATHPSILAWRIPGDRGAWRAAIYGVAQNRTRLKQLSSKGCLASYTVREVLMASILGWFAIPSSSGSCFVRDLVDAEEIKKRWKYMEELYKQDLNEPDYSDGVASHQEPDILECEVKWALRSIAINKASGCDEISAELFRSLQDDDIEVLHSLCQQIWKT